MYYGKNRTFRVQAAQYEDQIKPSSTFQTQCLTMKFVVFLVSFTTLHMLFPFTSIAQQYQANWVRLGTIEPYDYFYDSNSLAIAKDGNVFMTTKLSNSDAEARRISTAFKINTPVKYTWVAYVFDVEAKSAKTIKRMWYSADISLLDQYTPKDAAFEFVKQGSVLDHFLEIASTFKSERGKQRPSGATKKKQTEEKPAQKTAKDSVTDKYN